MKKELMQVKFDVLQWIDRFSVEKTSTIFWAKYENVTRHKISYLIHYDILLQNATAILLQRDGSSLQNALGFLLQNATVLLENVSH